MVVELARRADQSAERHQVFYPPGSRLRLCADCEPNYSGYS